MKILETNIIAIKQSQTYATIINIKDLDEYFKTIKQQLEAQLEELRAEIEA